MIGGSVNGLIGMKLTGPVLSVILTLLAACHSPSSVSRNICGDGDRNKYVIANGICLGLKTYFPSARRDRGAMVIYLHGDGTAGGAVDYQTPSASDPPPGAIFLIMIRPGYYASEGVRSSGYDGGRRDNYTAENVDAIARGIGALKEYHDASRVILVGHSGGAAIAGIIIGRYPGLVQGALLIACPCDVARWRADTGGRPYTLSLSPSTYVGSVPIATMVVALTGANDVTTLPSLAEEYVSQLRRRGVDAEFIRVLGAGHGWNAIADSSSYDRALRKLIDRAE